MSNVYQCPYCNQLNVVSSKNYENQALYFDIDNKYDKLVFDVHFFACANPDCKEFSMTAELRQAGNSGGYMYFSKSKPILLQWNLKPNSMAKPFPSYIPKAILDDYTESCLIADLSPKSSATLARRCLQGMIRDFWQVKPDNLFKEIEAIKDKVSPEVWASIEVVRKIGNIGAHMEKDINQIIDVEPDEAKMLISLIEILIGEWYINRHNREQKLKSIQELGQQKENERHALKNAS